MAKGIFRLVKIARENVEGEIRIVRNSARSERSKFFAAGLAGEGYFGGYRDALDDVVLALNGNIPQRNGWWERRDKPNK